MDKIPSRIEGLFWLTIQGCCLSLWGDRAAGVWDPLLSSQEAEMKAGVHFPFSFCSVQDLSPRMLLKPLDRRGLSSSLNPIWKLPPRHTQKCVSYRFEIIASWQARRTVTVCFRNTESCLSPKCLREAAALRTGNGYQPDGSLPCNEQWVQVMKNKWGWNSER